MPAFESWLLGMALGAGAPGGMLGMAGGIFIALAATTLVAALIYAISGFGFAVLAAPLFLLFLDPARAIQLAIIISTALAIGVVPGLLRAIAPGCCYAWHWAALSGCRLDSSLSVMPIRSWCGRPPGPRSLASPC
jgi:hypothetical protein